MFEDGRSTSHASSGTKYSGICGIHDMAIGLLRFSNKGEQGCYMLLVKCIIGLGEYKQDVGLL